VPAATAGAHGNERAIGHDRSAIDRSLAQQTIDFGEEEALIDRLGDRAVRSGRPCVLQNVGLRRCTARHGKLQVPARGNREDAHAWIRGAERADDIDAVTTGHEDVDERNVWTVLFEERDGLNAVRRFDHFMPSAAEHGTEDASRIIVIVGNENPRQ